MDKNQHFSGAGPLLAFPTLILLLTYGCFGKDTVADRRLLNPTLTIQVYNHGRVPSHMLRVAERETEEILEKAGLHALWEDCFQSLAMTSIGACSKGSQSNLVRIIVVAGPKQNTLNDTISGVALPPSTAEVFYDYLPRLAKSNDNLENRAIVLGCVMAHEIGHLLLGSGSHSISGIMQGAWGAEQLRCALMGQLVFLKEESVAMQAVVKSGKEQGQNEPAFAPIVDHAQ